MAFAVTELEYNSLKNFLHKNFIFDFCMFNVYLPTPTYSFYLQEEERFFVGGVLGFRSPRSCWKIVCESEFRSFSKLISFDTYGFWVWSVFWWQYLQFSIPTVPTTIPDRDDKFSTLPSRGQRFGDIYLTTKPLRVARRVGHNNLL